MFLVELIIFMITVAAFNVYTWISSYKSVQYVYSNMIKDLFQTLILT